MLRKHPNSGGVFGLNPKISPGVDTELRYSDKRGGKENLAVSNVPPDLTPLLVPPVGMAAGISVVRKIGKKSKILEKQ
jgi:hypothetical protein